MLGHRNNSQRIARLGCFAAALAALAALAISPAVAAEKFKVTLNDQPSDSSIGIVYAEVLGYYKEAGIDLEIESGKGSGSTSQLVAAGNTDVGLASGPSALSIAAKGAPVKIIAPVFQKNGFGIVSLKDGPISKPKDLEGKTFAITPGSANIPLFEAMVKANAIDKSNINMILADDASFIALLNEKKVDAVSDAPGDQMVPLEFMGVETKIMYYADIGVPTVGISLIARDDKLKQNPELYKKFVNATLKGYAAAAKNPDAAIDALFEKYPNSGSKDRVSVSLKKYTLSLLCLQGSTGLGRAPADLWKSTGQALDLGDGIGAMHTDDYLPTENIPCP
ncbi:ABC transporter substrate-binding protein [Mesorhizobium sp. M0578]|uniref:ABC transporter substrate-binding protein n=1 Tax=unclassified Mesorhizobium TaxID=325217 RepID=UPI00333AF060